MVVFCCMSLQASYITFKHYRQLNSASEISSLVSVRSVIDSARLPKYRVGDGENVPAYKCFAYSENYMSYETNMVGWFVVRASFA